MKKLFILTALLQVFLCTASIAQESISEVKSDNTYIWAYGSGATIEAARHDALTQMAEKISSNVSSKTIYSTEEKSSSMSVSSFMSLQYVSEKLLTDDSDEMQKLFCYISKDEIENMYESREKKILGYINTGKTAEKNLQIDDALRNYYWALMLAKANGNRVVNAEFNGENHECASFLPTKIKSVIANLRVTMEDCWNENNRYYTKLNIAYNDRNVSSLQLKYFDGESISGLNSVRDGSCELKLVSLPIENLELKVEYAFSSSAKSQDDELRYAFESIKLPSIENTISIPVKVNASKDVMVAKQSSVSAPATSEVVAIAPETGSYKKHMELEIVNNDAKYLEMLAKVESAIKNKNPLLAKTSFTDEGYKMFETLLKKTGTVSLLGKEQDYEFVRADGQILGRFCKVKIAFSNGRNFAEKLTFRIDEEAQKITSFAFALTEKTETDIFNAATNWPKVSRFQIMNFMEDYQTAYFLKRRDYLDLIYSDEAIIITGTVLKKASSVRTDDVSIPDFGDRVDVKYTQMDKKEFMERLDRQFSEKKYVHLTFEETTTKQINSVRVDEGAAFAIQLHQYYESSNYMDKGYLTLILDLRCDPATINVRLWQPDKTDTSDITDIDDFMAKFSY